MIFLIFFQWIQTLHSFVWFKAEIISISQKFGVTSNRVLLVWTEVCHQIFAGWEVQIMWKLKWHTEKNILIQKMFTNRINMRLSLLDTQVSSSYDSRLSSKFSLVFDDPFCEFRDDLLPYIIPVYMWRCPWCNGYRHRKWTRWHEFKSWTRMIAFHIALIPLRKVWIQLFSLQLWVNSRTD